MKKKQVWIIMIMLLSVLLSGCGAKSVETEDVYVGYAAGSDSAAPEMFATQNMIVTEEEKSDFLMDDVAIEEPMGKEQGTEAEMQTVDFAEKIIYTGNVYVETTDFDASIVALNDAVEQFGGFVQDSSVSGHSSGDRTAVVDRFAFYVVRIPANQFDAFMSVAGDFGNVTSSGRNAQNVTSQYTDYEARLTSLRTQEERLLDMLGKTGDLESMIALEARMSEVRYEIERIERELRNMDQRLAYSTVTVDLQEVAVYTQTAPVKRTFGEKVSTAFRDGWQDFADGTENFAVNIVRSMPTLILLAVIAGGAVVVIRRTMKKRKARKELPTEEPKE